MYYDGFVYEIVTGLYLETKNRCEYGWNEAGCSSNLQVMIYEIRPGNVLCFTSYLN